MKRRLHAFSGNSMQNNNSGPFYVARPADHTLRRRLIMPFYHSGRTLFYTPGPQPSLLNRACDVPDKLE